MRVLAYHGQEVGSGGKYHVADILPAASKGALLPLVVDADEKGFTTDSTRTVVVLVSLSVVLLTVLIVL